MPSAYLVLQAEKSPAYFDSLCKHFARKVEVIHDGDKARVNFAMGYCEMSADTESMSFAAHAEEDEALKTVKYIIESHAVRFGELKDAKVEWRQD